MRAMTLRPVSAKEVHTEWPAVRAGLEAMKHLTVDDWLPEDVYVMLHNGSLALYVGEDEQQNRVGFLLLQLLPTFHGTRLHIWSAYSSTKRQLISTYWPEIKAIAKQYGANRITFTSSRDEWKRVNQRLGCSLAGYEYFIEV
jgi:hypothetical protein